MIEPFASKPSPKLVFGPGTLNELPACVREIGCSAVLLVSDSGIARAGHLTTAQHLLETAGIPVAIFDHSKENPTESDVAICCDYARTKTFDCIVALGGGSSMDTAKDCKFLLRKCGR